MIPDSAADTETFLLILVMMQVVIAPETLHPSKRGVPGMDRIVHATIKQIAQKKSGEEHKTRRPHGQTKDAKKNGRDDQAGNRGHAQTFFVPGIVVMITMQDIDEFLCLPAFGYPVKYKPVHDVFEEGPKKHSREKG